MKLVTFVDDHDGSRRLGALVEGDRWILDVQAAATRRQSGPVPAYRSMQHLIEAGDDALAGVRAMVADHDKADCVDRRREGQLLSPLPSPVQMRGCMCFDEHLTNRSEKRRVGKE